MKIVVTCESSLLVLLHLVLGLLLRLMIISMFIVVVLKPMGRLLPAYFCYDYVLQFGLLCYLALRSCCCCCVAAVFASGVWSILN